MEMGHGVAMGTVFGTKENVNQNQSIKLNQSKMILILKVIMYMALIFLNNSSSTLTLIKLILQLIITFLIY